MSSDDVWGVVQGRYDVATLERVLAGKSIASLNMDGWTPLHYACDNRAVTSLRPLLVAGGSVSAVDEAGYTPLHLLCKNSEISAIALTELVKAGATAQAVTTDGKATTSLHLLCMNERVNAALLKTLLAAPGADLNAMDGDGNTPLHYLASNHSLKEDTYLLALRDSPTAIASATQNHFKATALHYLCQNAQVTPAMLHHMLRLPAIKPNARDNIGNSALHALCENSRVTVDLLREFMSPDVPTSDTTLANSFGKRPFESLTSDACIVFAQAFAPQHEIASGTMASSSPTPGGEDISELQGPLLAKVQAWNASLPPFDDAFYVAISCEPAFEATYEQVQELSLALHANADVGVAWEAQMATWRKCVVLAFAALVHPSMWAQYSTSFGRPVPADLARVRPSIDAVWQRTPADRRERLAAIQKLL
ncbi:hypothetical protein ACHHYP_13785 [Achlya hypogyna]|uniref:Uncharacterized protein n=1 Tax=Achlya hypogyna TaxID=1202772 RepID=A0A1V9YEN6_ACHHY|nr:hypothetical protein ACHHYP_13785 [Achlya hypogyna]